MDKDILCHQQEILSSALAGKTVLVNGATGLIGSRIVRYLIALNDYKHAGIKIMCCFRNKEKKNKMYNDVSDRKDVVFLGVEENKAPDYACPIDYVIQAAGISGGSKMHLKDPLKIFEASYEATKSLLDFSVSNGARKFLYVSTYEIYGSVDSDKPIKEDAYCNLDTFTLRNSYAECKRICESLCSAYSSKYGIETFSGRLTSTFGAGVKYDDSRFFAEFARCIIEERDIILKSRGGTIRTYLDADDAASAFLYIIVKGENCNVYNVTNMDNQISIKDIAAKMISVTDSSISLKFDINDDIERLGYRKEGCTIVDSTKLMNLGWHPVYTLDDTLLKLINSMKTDYRQCKK